MKQALQFIVLLALVACPVRAFPLTRSVPPESFLDFHVDTVPQLAFEVAYDPAVRARLAHHFHLSGPAMSAYVRRNLVLSRLKAPLKTRVYCVASNGHEYYVVMTLAKGAAVFSQRGSGKPVLRLLCGNPLTAMLPPAPPLTAINVVSPAKTAVQSALEQQITPSLAAAAPVELSSAALPVSALPVISTVGAGDVLFTAGGGTALGWLPLALGVSAGLASAQAGSGGATSGAAFVPHAPASALLTEHPAAPPAVPEPNPGMVLVLGGLYLAAWRMWRAQQAR